MDHNGLIETATVLSDLVVAGSKDINGTERAEDQVMLYGALIAFAEMAEVLGSQTDAAWAKSWAERVRTGLNTLMWRDEGRYIFGLERASKRPCLEYVTTTYADGYAILFDLADADRTKAILDFMSKQEFVVPGPYHIPPVRAEDHPQNPPGVYCNGGCGWGRGIMPSVALACFRYDRVAQGVDYLKRQAIAARKAGSFHEYWTWEKYAGATQAGGAPWYGETSAGYLDTLLHGLFGISSPTPGFTALGLHPRFPENWTQARLKLRLPQGSDLELTYRATKGDTVVRVDVSSAMPIELILPWQGRGEPKVEVSNQIRSRIEPVGGNFQVVASWQGPGEIRLSRP